MSRLHGRAIPYCRCFSFNSHSLLLLIYLIIINFLIREGDLVIIMTCPVLAWTLSVWGIRCGLGVDPSARGAVLGDGAVADIRGVVVRVRVDVCGVLLVEAAGE